jgi:hypothetical protein
MAAHDLFAPSDPKNALSPDKRPRRNKSPGRGRRAAPSVRAEFFKAVYLGCLERLSAAEIARGLSACIGGGPKRWDAPRLLSALWHERGEIPLHFLLSFFNGLERTLLEKGIEPGDFFLRTATVTNDGAMVKPSTVLQFFGSFLSGIFMMNLRELLLDTIKPLNEYLFSGIKTEVVSKRKTGKRLEYVVAAKFPPSLGVKIVGSAWLCPLFRSLGTGFGFPPMEEVRIISETCSIAELRKRGYGSETSRQDAPPPRLTAFSRYLSEAGIELPGSLAFADTTVEVCPAGLFRGDVKDAAAQRRIACNAPMFLFGITADRRYQRHRFSLKKIIDRVIGKKASRDINFQTRHRCVETLVGGGACLRYDELSSRVFCNDHPVCGGVPARMLAAMLRANRESGTVEFSKDFFAADGRILKSKLDKSFNVNIKRAIAHAHATIPFVAIERNVGAGTLRLHVKGEFRFLSR